MNAKATAGNVALLRLAHRAKTYSPHHASSYNNIHWRPTVMAETARGRRWGLGKGSFSSAQISVTRNPRFALVSCMYRWVAQYQEVRHLWRACDGVCDALQSPLGASVASLCAQTLKVAPCGDLHELTRCNCSLRWGLSTNANGCHPECEFASPVR